MNVIVTFKKDEFKLKDLVVVNVQDIIMYEDEIEIIHFADKSHEKVNLVKRKCIPKKLIRKYEVGFYDD